MATPTSRAPRGTTSDNFFSFAPGANPFDFPDRSRPGASSTPAKVEGPSTPVQAPKFDLLGAIQALLQGQADSDRIQQSNQREAQGGIHRDMSGRPIDQTAPAPGEFGSPITFESPEARYAKMAAYPNISAPPRNDYSNPYFSGALPEAAPAPQVNPPQVGSYVPGPMGTMDLVGPKDPLSGGGNILQQGIVPGSGTAAPPAPGRQVLPSGNAVEPLRPKSAARPPFRYAGGMA